MPATYDVAIIGLGAMGSAAAYHLARRGRRVIGFDRFTPPHTFGSSHGESRVIREAYYEDPAYVPIVQRAYELWAALEQEAGESLFRQTGGLWMGPEEGAVVAGARASAERHGLAHELLDAAALRRRYPAFAPSAETVAVWEPRAGFLVPERCLAAHLSLAQRHGATLRFDEPLTVWLPDSDGFLVRTAQGDYRAHRLLLTAGAWTAPLLSGLRLPLRVTRQLVFWFDPAANAANFEPDRFPVFLWEQQPDDVIYGIPNLGAGVKIGLHTPVDSVDPDRIDRTVSDREMEAVRQTLRRCLPDANGVFRSAQVCMYTSTPDAHFLIDFHPEHSGLLIASPCSGHGFKFSSAFGEILADLLLDGRSAFDLSLFRLNRLR